MKKLLIFAIVGFFAQIIDGSLGMAFGATSSSLLLVFGVAPAVVSASIHISEIATTASSGISHWRFGNVDKQLLWRLIIPGSISAFLGAAFLSNLNGEVLKPFISLFLFLMGIYIIIRFMFKFYPSEDYSTRKLKNIFLIPLGALAGFFDAVGGGGWGPINTPILLSKKGFVPRKVIGTVSASEFAVTLSASLGFLLFLGWEQINWLWVAGFALGGVVAAPFAAWLVKVIPTYLLGVLVGGLIVFTNAQTLIGLIVEDDVIKYIINGSLILVWIALFVYAVFSKNEKKIEILQNTNL
ncbi:MULTISPECIES: sulfite exporter TauE/SafE family protein [Bacillus]|uniref:Probable membrane transporter protein n=2 Tax=Bacillus TaxID=1386 RepID=A0A0M5J9U9_9BACI|nr:MULTISPECIES: sulfite exporter TauE/SafE family protein [Bacillus]ALC81239.1 hypothetical protein AM592_06255 [Bacillus gobiensis]MBP1080235.1 putative membrane protein YfcA [Bacillus capparidis]MED1094103.1 sulfite exporter TauE/SafE family protein [Bacillus capparidis]